MAGTMLVDDTCDADIAVDVIVNVAAAKMFAASM
jgi:hypothetical protein